MEFLKEWADFENQQDQAINAFESWEKLNLVLTAGTVKGSVLDKFGLPYTSSGEYACLGVTNCQAEYKYCREFTVDDIAITTDNLIVVNLTSKLDYQKTIQIPIGKIEK